MTPAFDFIVVGAGSAGCVLANRLSADPARRVLLLEAGGSDWHPWIHLPVGYFKTIFDERFARQFQTAPSSGLGGRSLVWPRGRVLGGSSSINALVYLRGQHDDFDDWERQGATGWGFRSVLPHFKAGERYEGGETKYHGAAGELGVSELRMDHSCCTAWLEAAQQYGLPLNRDFNADTTYGVGSLQLTLDRRWRSSSASAFLKPARRRPNLIVQTRAHVTRVLFEGTRAVGVEWLHSGQIASATATSEVILSGGAVQSPQILQLSGVGPAALMRRHDIPVIADVPEVGANLQDHYQSRTVVRLKDRISLNDDSRNPVRLAAMGADWLFRSRGPLTVGAGQVGGGATTHHAADHRPDVQFTVMPLSVDKPGAPLHRFSGFTAAVFQCRPQSRGTIRVTSADPLEAPLIEPNYLSVAHDVKTLAAGVEMLRDIYAQPAFRDLVAEEVVPGSGHPSSRNLQAFVRENGGTVFHPSGTCRMGSDESAVVDPELRVRGVDGLRVIDASIMPTITSANINAVCVMIGEKGARHVLGNG